MARATVSRQRIIAGYRSVSFDNFRFDSRTVGSTAGLCDETGVKIVIVFTMSTILRATVFMACMSARAVRCRSTGHLDFQAIPVAPRAILKKSRCVYMGALTQFVRAGSPHSNAHIRGVGCDHRRIIVHTMRAPAARAASMMRSAVRTAARPASASTVGRRPVRTASRNASICSASGSASAMSRASTSTKLR